MSRRRRFAVASALASALAGALAACASSPGPDGAYLRGFQAAEASGRAFAPISALRPDATLGDAYRLQKSLVADRLAHGERAAGYKGGLMSQASLQARGVTRPLVGVLFASGRTAPGGAVSLCGYRKASFEAKLGFVFREAVRTPPAGVEALKRIVAGVAPVVDLPDIAYRDPDHYSAVDMVAANVSAARYVRGSARSTEDVDLNALEVTMARDGQALTRGAGRESLGDQWESLLTVVDQVLASGRTIAQGDLVLTGKIGDRGWLPPGNYVADYGPLGSVPFAVRACAKGLVR